jgi:hypothetical protein
LTRASSLEVPSFKAPIISYVHFSITEIRKAFGFDVETALCVIPEFPN